jgi:ABC-type antimicrobial peptide transport system permease subunit
MNEQTQQLIRELAEKLGTTAEHLWSVLIQQALITGIVDTLIMLTFGVILVRLFIFVKAKTTKRGETPTSYPHADWEDEPAFIAWFGWAVLAFIFSLILAGNASMTMAAFLNPEYWALMQVLGK